MSSMRTTLTIDDDLVGLLRSKSRELDKPFKELVNNALRIGLCDVPTNTGQTVRTRPAALGLRPGLDSDRMNQLMDELEVDHYLKKESLR